MLRALMLSAVALVCVIISFGSLIIWIKPRRPSVAQVGGTELEFTVDHARLPPNAGDIGQAEAAAILKRLDPDRIYGIECVPDADLHMHIRIPAPAPAVAQAREQSHAAEAELRAATWNEMDLQALTRKTQSLTPEQRTAAISAFLAQHHITLPVDPATTSGPKQARPAFAAVVGTLDHLAIKSRAMADVAARLEGQDPANWNMKDIQERRVAEDELEKARTEALAAAPGVDMIVEMTGAARDPDNVAARVALEQLLERFPLHAPNIARYVDARRAEFALSNGMDDPREVQRILAQGGVISFRIAVLPSEMTNDELENAAVMLRAQGAAAHCKVHGVDARWFAISAENVGNFSGLVVTQYHGSPLVLCYNDHDHTLTHDDPRRQSWTLEAKSIGVESSGDVILPFKLDAVGGNYMADLTSDNLHHPMAILLDDSPITAPTIQGVITTSGMITYGRPSGARSAAGLRREAEQTRLLMNSALPAALVPDPIAIHAIPPIPNYHPFPWAALGTILPLLPAAVALFLLLKPKPKAPSPVSAATR